MSPPGNLYASTLVRLGGGEPPAPTLALVAAIALHEAVSVFGGASVAIKWPNDLLLDDAKLSGILLERSDDAVVVGLGVNLAHHPDDIDRVATSLAAAAGVAPDPDIFLGVLADSFARWLYRWRTEGLAPIRAAWLDRAHPIGTALRVRIPTPSPSTPLSANGSGGAARDGEAVMPEPPAPDTEALHGLFDGLDESGALRLRLADGTLHVIHAADVFLVRD